MKKTFFLSFRFASVSLVVAMGLFAASGSFAETCIHPKTKKVVNGTPMPPGGPLAGYCINTRHARPVEVIKETETEIWLKNFQHVDGFHVARIPKQSFKTLILQKEAFFPQIVAAHVQLRFQMQPGKTVDLYPNELSLHKIETGALPELTALEKLNNFLFSVEAVGVIGYNFNLWEGLVNRYALVNRFVSVEYKVNWSIVQQGNEIAQTELPFSSDEIDLAFALAIKKSVKEQYHRRYNLLGVNCANQALLHVIEPTLDSRDGYEAPSCFDEIKAAFPTACNSYLEGRSILGSEGKLKELQTLNQEMARQAIRTPIAP